MARKLSFIFVLAALVLFVSPAFAKDKVVLKEGTVYEGDIVDENYDEINLKMEDKVRIIPKGMINEIFWDYDVITKPDGKVLKGKIISDEGGWITLRLKHGSVRLDSQVDVEKHEKKIEQEKIEYVPRETKDAKTPGARKTQQSTAVSLSKEYKFPDPTENLSQPELMQLHNQAMALLQQKKYAEAIQKYEKILLTNPKDMIALYNMACAYSLMKKKAEAIKYLIGSILAGFTDFVHFGQDKDLDFIRDSSEYKNIIKQKDEIMLAGAALTMDRLKQEYGTGYTYDIDEKRRLICATNQSMAVLERLQAHMSDFADAHWRDLFKTKPEFFITVILPSEQDFNKRRPAPNVAGWYDPMKKELICSDQSMTLDHEFTHALHFADNANRKQGHPIHILEGVSTLYEYCTIANGKIIPAVGSPRMQFAIQLAQMQRHYRFREFFKVTVQTFQGQQTAGICYSQVRYMFVYLYIKGKFYTFFEKFVKDWETDKDGVKTFESVFGQTLEQIEQDWLAWVRTLAQKPPEMMSDGFYDQMGLNVQFTSVGLAVRRVNMGSTGDLAGIKEGDIIEKVDDSAIADVTAYFSLLDAKKLGDKVKVKTSRKGKSKVIAVEVGNKITPQPGR